MVDVSVSDIAKIIAGLAVTIDELDDAEAMDNREPRFMSAERTDLISAMLAVCVDLSTEAAILRDAVGSSVWTIPEVKP